MKSNNAARDETNKRFAAFCARTIQDADLGVSYIRQVAGRDTRLTNRQRDEWYRKEKKQRDELFSAMIANF
jgi:hypothetical protein